MTIEENNSSNPVSPIISNESKLSGKNFKILSGFILAIGLILIVVGFSAAVYILPVNNSFVRSVTTVVPYPIAVVNGHSLTFKEFYGEWDALENYLSKQSNPVEQPQAELQGQVLDTMIDRQTVKQLAKQFLVELDQAKVQETVAGIVSQSGSEEEFYTQIKDEFGWDKTGFLEHAIEPMVLASQVEEVIFSDETFQKEAKAKIDGALQRLKNNELFATVATEISDDKSAATGGNLGFLDTASLPPEWVTFFTTSDLNVPSEVIDLGSVYTIVEATDKVEGETGTQYATNIIVVYKKSMTEVIDSFLISSKIWKFLRT